MGAEEKVTVMPPEAEVEESPLPPLPQFGAILGSAGTGKSTLIKKYLAARRDVVVTATTGVAALNTGGTTINSRLGYYDLFSLQQAAKSGRLVKSFLSHYYKGIKTWIVDEVSMMGGDQLTILTKAVEQANQELSSNKRLLTMVKDHEPNDPSQESALSASYASMTLRQGSEPVASRVSNGHTYPSGGSDHHNVGNVPTHPRLAEGRVHRKLENSGNGFISLILVGDAAQLPPIKAPWFFESPKWPTLYEPNVTTLKVNYRQSNPDFIAALREARAGHGPGALGYFRDMIYPERDEGFGGLTILATNKEVDEENQRKLALCTGREVRFRNSKEGEPHRLKDWKSIPEELVLKIGAKVMILSNYRTREEGLVYVNGDMGTLVGTEERTPLVKLERNGAIVHVKEAERDVKVPWDRATEWEQQDYLSNLAARKAGLEAELECQKESLSLAEDELDRQTLQRDVDLTERLLEDMEEGKLPDFLTVAWMTYTPTRLAYASTVFKCQGLTLDKIQIDLASGFWTMCPGSLYVALSRARTPEGIRIVGSNERFLARCRADWKVRSYV